MNLIPVILMIQIVDNVVSVESLCSEEQFQCTDGKCITNDWVCDGARDCSDGSDEHHEACDRHLNKNSPCFGNQPECKKHGLARCIPHEWLCDGHPDCDAGEDEANCTVIEWFRQPESLMHKYQKESLVVLISHNTSSELCEKTEFRCKNAPKCIKSNSVCNKVEDCEDGSDEMDCPDITSKSKSNSTTEESKPSNLTEIIVTTTTTKNIKATTTTTVQPKVEKTENISISWNGFPVSSLKTTTVATSSAPSSTTSPSTTTRTTSSPTRSIKRTTESTTKRKLEETSTATQKPVKLVETPPTLHESTANRTSTRNRSSVETVTRFSEIPRTVRYVKGVPIEPVNYINSSYVVIPEQD